MFFDTGLSADGRVSCATCHQPERAFADGLVHAMGAGHQPGTRNTPSLLDVGRQRSLFWDGRIERLEDQALDPLLNPVEHGLADTAQLIAKLRSDMRYVPLAIAAYGVVPAALTAPQVAEALAAYERTLVSAPSPFDRFRAGQRDAMSEAARHGWQIFDQRAHCTRCHVATDGDGSALFTDHQFHSLAVGLSKVERKLPALTARLTKLRGEGASLDILRDRELAELGRFAVTLDPRDLAAFKTPGLRNVARTAPYMHDGSVATLAEAVDLEMYSRGASLTPVERADVIAFLGALTSGHGVDVPPGSAIR